MNLSKFNPVVDKKILVLIAGIMWCGVGMMLMTFAITWLTVYAGHGKLLFYIAGYLAAIPIHLWGFLKIAEKNLNRLLPLTTKKCVFSFMTWRSYIIVLIMVSMGIALRHSLIPKQYLSILYNGIGLALFLSGTKYVRFFFILLYQNGSDTCDLV
jgi:hypothetical protein